MKSSRTYLILLALLLAVLGSVFYWYQNQLRWVSVTDARVQSDIIKISSRRPGWIISIPVVEGQLVQSQEVLIKTDQRHLLGQLEEISASLQVAQARYRKTETEISLLEKTSQQQVQAENANLDAARANLEAVIIDADISLSDWQRHQSLVEQALVSQSEVDVKLATYNRSKELITAERAKSQGAEELLRQARSNLARVDLLKDELQVLNFEKEKIESQKRQVELQLSDTQLISPTDGIIDEIFMKPGEQALPGQRILMMHNPEDIWISANIKETKIRHVELGARVIIKADAFPENEFIGKVSKISRAATNQFSLIPAPNPSGNFTKITQRINVRIDVEDSASKLLNPGMMVVIDIERAP